MLNIKLPLYLGMSIFCFSSQGISSEEVIGLYAVNHHIDSPACIVGGKCTYEHRNDGGFADAFRIEVEANKYSIKVEEKLKYWCTDGSKVVTRFQEDRFVVDSGKYWESSWYRCPEGEQVTRVKVKAGTTTTDNDHSDSRVYIVIQN